jgi:hypothetical protein
VALSHLTSECRFEHVRRSSSSHLHLNRYGGSLVQFDPALEAKLRKKIDWAVLPLIALLYLFCFIDRANLGTHLPPPPRRNCQTILMLTQEMRKLSVCKRILA